MFGKTPVGVASVAKRHGKPVIAVAGHVGELGGRSLAFEQLAAVLLTAHTEHAAGTAHTAHHEPEQTKDNEERQ